MATPKIYLPYPAPPDPNRNVVEWRRCILDAFEVLRKAVGGTVQLTTYPPDVAPTSPDAMDDEFVDASLDAKWSLDNPGVTPVVLSTTLNGDGYLQMNYAGENAYHVRGINQAAPSAPWTIRAKIHHDFRPTAPGAGTDACGFGLYVASATSSRVWLLEVVQAATASNSVIRTAKYTDRDNFDNATSLSINFNSNPVYLEIENDGSHVIGRYSSTGFAYNLLAQYDIADALFPDTTVDYVGLAGWSRNSVVHLGLVDWFRRVA